MKDFSRGVSWYTGGTVQITFPEDDICCRWCPLMRVELKTDRAYCCKSGEYLVNPNFHVGQQCQITFDEVRKEEINEYDVP